ncbi:MAG: translation elongation factor Ts, partial [Pseudomonadota bacterium]
MSNITASMVKSLRDQTGAGMMDCKQALAENDGDIEAAVDWLRKKGLSKAAKKSDRVAAEGLVAVASGAKAGAVVEVNSETDFVARNEQFQAAVAAIAKLALDAKGDFDALKSASYPGTSHSVEEQLKDMVGTIGENMNLRRTAYQSVENGVVSTYVHNKVVDGAGKIGVLVGLNGSGDLAEAGRKVAMHVAATSPASATVEDLDPVLVERERQVLTEQAEQSGKPANVIEKMIEGRLKKYYKEVVLVEQPFVMNPDQTVGQFIKEAGAEFAG